jgi:hypothetical protein
MRVLVVMLAADHDVPAGNAKIYADVEEITLMLVLVLEFDRYPATDDVVVELLQFRRFFADSRFHGVGVRKAMKRNL